MNVISDFENHILYEKRFSQHTVTAYINDIRQFQDFLNGSFTGVELTGVSFRHIRSWIVSMIDGKVQARSVNRKISALNSLFKYLVRNNIIKNNPAEKVVLPKVKKQLPYFVDEKSMSRLFDEADFGEGFTGIRNFLIILLFYMTGIRLSELISLQLSFVDFSSSTIKVLGKRNKERLIPVEKGLVSAIREYLSFRESVETAETTLFITNSGKKLYPKLVYRVVTSYIKLASPVEKRSPHVLRHTFATHLLNNGACLNAIKELLGHSNLAATQVYTHNSFEKLRSIYNNAHPRA